MTDVYKTRIADVRYLEQGIILIEYQKDINITQADAIELMEVLPKISTEPCPRIHLCNADMSYEFGAINEFSKSKNAKSVAIVADDPRSKAILEDTKKVFTTLGFSSPVKFFSNLDDAIEWSLDFC